MPKPRYLILTPAVPRLRPRPDEHAPRVYRAIVGLLVMAVLVGAAMTAPLSGRGAEPLRLPAVAAVGVRIDTLLIGGYASGSLTEAVAVLARDLTAAERLMVRQHPDRIFSAINAAEGLCRSRRPPPGLPPARSPESS